MKAPSPPHPCLKPVFPCWGPESFWCGQVTQRNPKPLSILSARRKLTLPLLLPEGALQLPAECFIVGGLSSLLCSLGQPAWLQKLLLQAQDQERYCSFSPGLRQLGFFLCTPIHSLVQFLYGVGEGPSLSWQWMRVLSIFCSLLERRVQSTQGGGNSFRSRVLRAKGKPCSSDRVVSLLSDLTGIPTLTKVRQLWTICGRLFFFLDRKKLLENIAFVMRLV